MIQALARGCSCIIYWITEISSATTRPGRAVLQLAADDWLLEQLMTFDADAAELEEGGDAEPDDPGEADGPPVLALDLRRPRRVRRA